MDGGAAAANQILMSLNEYSTGSRGEGRGATSEEGREAGRGQGVATRHSRTQSDFPKSGTVKISRSDARERHSKKVHHSRLASAKKCQRPNPHFCLEWNRIESEEGT